MCVCVCVCDSIIYMMLKIGHFENWTKNTWKVLKCGAGEEWKSIWTDRVENEVLRRVK